MTTRPATRVLIVDDEPANLATFARAFRRDLAVVTALSGDEALEQLASQPFDVVVSDFRMPGMHGVALLERVRDGWPKVGRVLMTAYVDEPEVRKARAAGLALVLGKPWDHAAVIAAIGCAPGVPTPAPDVKAG